MRYSTKVLKMKHGSVTRLEFTMQVAMATKKELCAKSLET